MGRASKDKRDIYYRKAKEEGYRARSAYKLLQIDDEFGIFKGVRRAVDLCAAPGSWSQVLSARLPPIEEGEKGSRIVAVDLQEMAPITGVHILQGDITTVKTANEVIEGLGGCMADLVVSDGAPDVTGIHELDEYVQHQLLLAALNITTFVLRPGGTYVAKMFRGPNTPFLCAKSEIFFKNVTIVKPKSSRNTSMEAFILCQDYCPPPGFVPTMIDPVSVAEYFPQNLSNRASGADGSGGGGSGTVGVGSSGGTNVNARIVPFLACGDLDAFDSDMCYDRDAGAATLPPVQPPTTAPYLEALSSKRARKEGQANTASEN